MIDASEVLTMALTVHDAEGLAHGVAALVAAPAF